QKAGQPAGIPHDRRDDVLRTASQFRIPEGEPLGEVRVGTTAESRDDDADQGDEESQAPGENPQAEREIAFGEQDVGAEPDPDQRQFLLDEEGRQQAQKKESALAALEEIDREAQWQHRQRHLVEVVEIDEGDREEKK